MALEEGKAPFVDEETEAEIIGMNLLQLLGIQRQAEGKEAGLGAKVMGVRGMTGPLTPAVTFLPCDSDLGPGPANTNVPQRQAGSQGSGLFTILPLLH